MDTNGHGAHRFLARPPLVAAAIALLGVALVIAAGVPVLTAAPKPAPSASAVAAGTTLYPTAQATASATASPNATPSPLACDPNVRLLAAAETIQARWAPDGAHVALESIDLPRVADLPTWVIYDRSGHQAGRVDANLFAWSGPADYVLARWGEGRDGGWAYVAGRLGSEVETPSPPQGGLEVARLPCVVTRVGESFTAMVGGKEVARDGFPMACSSDGRLAAVIKVANGMGVSGTLQIERLDTGRILLDIGIELGGGSPVAFSPDGHHLFAGNDWIVDLPSGKTRRIAFDASSAAWLPDGRLVVGNSEGDTAAFDPDGTPVPRALPRGEMVSVSPLGTIAGFGRGSTTNDSIGLVAATGATTLTFDLPPVDIVWAPDGRAAIVVCGDYADGATWVMKAYLVFVP